MYVCASRLLRMSLLSGWVVSIAVRACHADDTMLKALREGYLENRESFRSFSCRFRLSTGATPSVEAAIAGRIDDPVVQDGLWIVKGQKVRYELTCRERRREELPDLKSLPKGQALVSSQCNSQKSIGNGILGLHYSRGLEAANLISLKSRGLQINDTPISMGAMGRDEDISPARAPKGIARPPSAQYLGTEVVDGRPLHVILYTEEGQDWSQKWYLDTDRGCVPIEMRFYSSRDQLSSRCIATEIRKCGNGAYMPARSVSIGYPEGKPPHRVVAIELVELDLRPPDDRLFAISLPAGVAIVNADDLREVIRLKADETLHVDHLDAWQEKCRGAALTHLPLPALSDAKPKAVPRWVWVVSALAVAAVAAGIGWRWRLRHRRAES